MRWLLIMAASIATSTSSDVSAIHSAAAQAARDASPRVVLDNPRVRVYRATASISRQSAVGISRQSAVDCRLPTADCSSVLTGVDHGPAVVVSLEDGPGAKAGSAVWVEDAADPSSTSIDRGSIVIVQPRRQAAATAPPAGSKPGEAAFTGMSFNPIFENDRVSVIRARMEVGAREGFHAHGSDTIVVHLSGGEIEDTANGTTVVNRWKRGDVEFEGLGTSHSAINVGGAVDVVLVALKPHE
jgi:quercetin dioxygenase-like cupin family protein